MTRSTSLHRLAALACCVALSVAGCAFGGVNSLALPGTVGRGSHAHVYHVEITNVGTLEPNSPVMVNDVVVGSIVRMKVKTWYADVEISLRPEIVVPANAVAAIGQTSLLGSSHLALDPPLGEKPTGRLPSGATLLLNRSSVYPSTEQTLASISALVNAGGLGQIGEIIHNMNVALSGHEGQFRDLLARLDHFVGTFDTQRDDVIDAMRALSRVTETFSAQRDVLARGLREIPPALDVLIEEQPRIVTALSELGAFSDTATRLVHDTQADLLANLRNLEPTIRSLADVGPDLDRGLAYLSTYPLTQDLVDRGVRGDYINFYATLDLTTNRLKRGIALGTRWGREGLSLVPAPGDPGYNQYYTKNPLGAPVSQPPPPPGGASPGGGG